MEIEGVSSQEPISYVSDLSATSSQEVRSQGLASTPDSIDLPQAAPKPHILWRVATSIALITVHIVTLGVHFIQWAFHQLLGISNEEKRLYQQLHTIAETEGPEKIRSFLQKHSRDSFGICYLFSEFLNMPDLYPHLPQILQGANVCLEGDRGFFCRRWQTHSECYERPSSHQYQGDSCYAIDHLLFWIDLEGNTRLQFENSPWRGAWNSLYHVFDFLRYQRDNEQQGVTGTSPHTEDFCLKIPISQKQSEN